MYLEVDAALDLGLLLVGEVHDGPLVAVEDEPPLVPRRAGECRLGGGGLAGRGGR